MEHFPQEYLDIFVIDTIVYDAAVLIRVIEQTNHSSRRHCGVQSPGSNLRDPSEITNGVRSNESNKQVRYRMYPKYA